MAKLRFNDKLSQRLRRVGAGLRLKPEETYMIGTMRRTVFAAAALALVACDAGSTSEEATVAPGTAALVSALGDTGSTAAQRGSEILLITGSDTATLRTIADSIGLLLRREARVVRVDSVDVMLPPDYRETDYSLEVSYDFRGPAKLADRVRRAIAAAAPAPSGYHVVASRRVN